MAARPTSLRKRRDADIPDFVAQVQHVVFADYPSVNYQSQAGRYRYSPVGNVKWKKKLTRRTLSSRIWST